MSGPPQGPGPGRAMSVGNGPPSAGLPPQHQMPPQQQNSVPPPSGGSSVPQTQNLNQIVSHTASDSTCALSSFLFILLVLASPSTVTFLFHLDLYNRRQAPLSYYLTLILSIVPLPALPKNKEMGTGRSVFTFSRAQGQFCLRLRLRLRLLLWLSSINSCPCIISPSNPTCATPTPTQPACFPTSTLLGGGTGRYILMFSFPLI